MHSSPVLLQRSHSELYTVPCNAQSSPVRSNCMGPPCTLARMLYASSAWWGVLDESDLNHLKSFLRRARRSGFLPDEAPNFKTVAARANSTLFGAIISNQHHVLRS